MVGGGEARRAGADDEHALPARRRLDLDAPALLDREVTEKALDLVDPDGFVERCTIAGGLAGVVTDPSHDRGERVLLHDLPPRPLVAVAALLRLVEPGLDVLAGGAGAVAGRHAVDVDGALGAPAAGLVGAAGADLERDRERLVHHSVSSWAEVRSVGCCGRRSPAAAPRCRAGAGRRRDGRNGVGAAGTPRPAPAGGSSRRP